MMTIVRTKAEAQECEQVVATALDELAREGARRMILAALEIEVEEYRQQYRDARVPPAAMPWWSAMGRPAPVASPWEPGRSRLRLRVSMISACCMARGRSSPVRSSRRMCVALGT